jgi:hypothetical protein
LENYSTRATAAAVRSLLKRARTCLEQQDWPGAQDFAARAMEADPASAEAHLSMFLAEHHLIELSELSGVARQMVSETPADRTPLKDILEEVSGREDPAAGETAAPEAPEASSLADASDATEVTGEDDTPAADVVPAADVMPDADVMPAVSETAAEDGAAEEKPATEAPAPAEDAATEMPAPAEDAAAEAAAPAEAPAPAETGPTAPVEAQAQLQPEEAPAPEEETSDELFRDTLKLFSPTGDAVSESFKIKAFSEQKITNLRRAKEAFVATFEDADWTEADALATLDLRRAMERSRQDAEAVFDAALASELSLLSDQCERAQERMAKLTPIMAATDASCAEAQASFEAARGAKRESVQTKYAFLKGNLKLARVCLYVAIAIFAVGAILLIITHIPHGSTVAPLVPAAFPDVFTPLGLALVVVGDLLLVVRLVLVRGNKDGLGARADEKAEATSVISSSAFELNNRIAEIKSMEHELGDKLLVLEDDAFDQTLEQLAHKALELSGETSVTRDVMSESSDARVSAQ